MAIIEDFKARFPEFDEGAVDTYLPILVEIYPCYYAKDYNSGACNKEIILNIIAHLLLSEIKQSPSADKSVTSRSADGLSVSYSSFARDDSILEKFFSTSKYGQRYLMLANSMIGGFFV